MTVLTELKVPNHLKQWVVDQNYSKYTAIDQGVWRYVMRQNHNFLKDVAHEKYTTGLTESGISINKIPKVEEMNECLRPFGWRAVTIDGFIPAVAFFSFQANGILPIASEIRKLKNILYTPAPDIIHEAAGHAPILCDPEYSTFVKLLSSIGAKAIATKEEHEVFEAARALSNLMETGIASDEEIKKAENLLTEKQSAVKTVSEAEQIARLYWWTVEFGMIGTTDNPKIFGAGLLSSVGESANSLTNKVKKLPFQLEHVIATSFDISKQQPHLFVCENFEQLTKEVLRFSETMAFKKGGTESLEKALKSEATATVEMSSGLQVTGTVTNIIKDEKDEAIFFKMEGPSTLSFENKTLSGHGKDRHFHGFSSPIGKLKSTNKQLEDFSAIDLIQHNIVIGERTTLLFESDVQVSGTVREIMKRDNKIILITLKEVTVTHNDKILFEPEWGEFDLAVGSTITSVFGGAADPENFFQTEDINQSVGQIGANKLEHNCLDTMYEWIRNIREKGQVTFEDEQELRRIENTLKVNFPKDWLLRLELVELLHTNSILHEVELQLRSQLDKLSMVDDNLSELINKGLKLLKS
ncbi:phenylalanine 4-monooxygenase [Lottiidibacillus patelloidae]|uniref:Phenylalanine 4-monooxygenase n=1 Tax=Lottiidibacillus patelloidae TaxID=2670334 RepID=A0A263BRD2_9BACI|nr:aromatic amino acid hydroxylase [Lottiidibacillus patelloidae]OZM56260.1 phenylalanine 4-monooxygenase [Lottiidibacillus patelloidae]